jgi:hypothetical protein
MILSLYDLNNNKADSAALSTEINLCASADTLLSTNINSLQLGTISAIADLTTVQLAMPIEKTTINTSQFGTIKSFIMPIGGYFGFTAQVKTGATEEIYIQVSTRRINTVLTLISLGPITSTTYTTISAVTTDSVLYGYCNPGDKIEIGIRTQNGTTCYIRNVNICYHTTTLAISDGAVGI